MAKVVMFMICDRTDAKPIGNGAEVQILVDPIAVLRPPFVPGTYSFGLAIGVRGVDGSQPCMLSFTIRDPQGEIILDSGVNELPPAPHEATADVPSEMQGFVISLQIQNVVMRHNGVYQLTLTVNGEELEAQEIAVYRE